MLHPLPWPLTTACSLCVCVCARLCDSLPSPCVTTGRSDGVYKFSSAWLTAATATAVAILVLPRGQNKTTTTTKHTKYKLHLQTQMQALATKLNIFIGLQHNGVFVGFPEIAVRSGTLRTQLQQKLEGRKIPRFSWGLWGLFFFLFLGWCQSWATQ